MGDILGRTRLTVPFEAHLADFPPRPAVAANPLAFVNTTQERCTWCWTAVTSNINNFLRPQAPRSQCQVVGDVLAMDCCGPGASSECAKERALGPALAKEGLYASPPANAAFADVVAQVDKGLPPGARIDLAGGGSHFVALVGYVAAGAGGGEQVNVADPLYGSGPVPLDELKTNYLALGEWTTTYHTS